MTQGDALFIAQLFVETRFQRQGIGTEVMNRMLIEARAEERAITLGVVKSNPARRLYEHVAVFQAIKAVEVAVREAAGLDSGLLGVKLMRAAFAPETGPLTNPNVERGEQVGRMKLFAGAIASYKNPMSHQEVDIDDPEEALEIVLLANHLLRIVELRAASKTGSQPQLSGTSPPRSEAGRSPGAVSDKI